MAKSKWSATCPKCREKQLLPDDVIQLGRCVYCGAALGVSMPSRVRKSSGAKRSFDDRAAYPRGYADPIVVKCSELRDLIYPLVEIREIEFQEGRSSIGGWTWLCQELGEETNAYASRAKNILFKQEWVSFNLVDRWLTALGLTNAVRDGTLKLYANPRLSRARIELMFHHCGDDFPEDLEFMM